MMLVLFHFFWEFVFEGYVQMLNYYLSKKLKLIKKCDLRLKYLTKIE